MKVPTSLPLYPEVRPNAIMVDELDDIPSHIDKSEHDASCYLRIGGKTTWRMPLDTTSISVPDRPDSVLELSGFRLVQPNGNDGAIFDTMVDFRLTVCYTIQCHVFESHAFRWKYIFQRDAEFTALGWISQRLTAAQWGKVEEDSRGRPIYMTGPDD